MAKTNTRHIPNGLRIFFFIAVLLTAAAVLMKLQVIRINPLFISGKRVIGADIARYQGDVNMEKLSGEGIQFLYIKATEGSSHTDIWFEENMQKARDAGLPAGAYHFFSMDSSGAKQAQHYIETVGDLSGCLCPAVDVEFYGDKQDDPPPVESVRAELHAFLAALEEEYHVKPVIYCGRAILDAYIDDTFDDYPFWIRSVYAPVRFATGHRWTIWQYTDHGRLEGYNGIETHIDLDVLHPDTGLEDLIIEE